MVFLLVKGTFSLTRLGKPTIQLLEMGDLVGRGRDGLLQTIPFPGPSTHGVLLSDPEHGPTVFLQLLRWK